MRVLFRPRVMPGMHGRRRIETSESYGHFVVLRISEKLRPDRVHTKALPTSTPYTLVYRGGRFRPDRFRPGRFRTGRSRLGRSRPGRFRPG